VDGDGSAVCGVVVFGSRAIRVGSSGSDVGLAGREVRPSEDGAECASFQHKYSHRVKYVML